MPTQPKKRSLLEIAVTNMIARHGVLKGTRRGAQACEHIIALAICARALDDGWPSQTDYAAYWKISDRSAQREWERVREAFPGEDGPDRLAQWLYAETGRRLDRKSTAWVSLPVPRDLIAS